jgi:hypothetical protein
MKFFKMLATSALVLTFAAPAFAEQTATPAIPATPATPATPGVAPAIPAQPATPAIPAARSRSAAPGIDQGIKSGALTEREATRMERLETKIENDVEKARADGKVARQGRKRLNKEVTQQNRAIHREKHNRRRR